MESDLGLAIVIGGFLSLVMLFLWAQNLVANRLQKRRECKNKTIDSKSSKLKLLFLLLASIGYVVIGVFMFNQSGIIYKIVSLIGIVLFGFGAVTLTWQMIKSNKIIPVVITLKEPESILVERNNNPDEEILEEWYRACELTDKDLQTVGATKWDHSPYPWTVTFGAAAFIREDPFSNILEDVLTQVLKQLPGVKDAAREDTECWVVDGEISGEELIRAGSVAIDKYLIKYRDKWLVE